MTENALDPLGSSELKPAKTSRLTTAGSRISSKTRKHDAQKQASDVVADEATAVFIRRTLCSHNALASSASGDKGRATPRPIEELLPPLTSSNDVDLQVYAIIAVILKEFVFPWYSKITPDHVFIDEVIQIIAHCTRALEQRFRKVDLEALLLDEIPNLIGRHVEAYRISQRSHRNPLAAHPRQIYHTLNAHPALSPVPIESDASSALQQRQNETQWRQLLVQGVLAVLLPTEDLENGCLRALVAEIFSEMILGGAVSEKACEGWMLWESIMKIAQTVRPQGGNEEAATDHDAPAALERTEQSSRKTPPNEGEQAGASARRPARKASVTDVFWLVLQYVYLAYHLVRVVIATLATSSSLPSRIGGGTSPLSPALPGQQSLPTKGEAALQSRIRRKSKRAILSMKAWRCCSTMLELDVRMPWVTGCAALVHWGAVAGPMGVGDTDGLLDRLLSYHIQRIILNPSLLPPLLRNVRSAVFPNNAMGPPRVVPTPSEALAIKCRCADVLVEQAIPPAVARILFATSDKGVMKRQVEEWLGVLDDAYMNKWLVFSIVELLVVRLMPELGEKGVVELMAERLG